MESRSRFATLLPGAGLAVLSKFTCSACLTAYAGLLASFGVGFVATDTGLTWLTGGLLTAGLVSVGWSTWGHRHPGPLMLVLTGSGVLLAARLTKPSVAGLAAGAVLMIAGSLWNLWVERRPRGCCVADD